MIQTAQALYSFFSGFNIPAYTENNVPDEATLPYLTYPLKEPEWNQKATFYVTVYYRNQTSDRESLAKADEIVTSIADGVRLPIESGYIVIRPDNPLIQTKPPDGDVRGAYINLSLNAYKTFGA